ncbi:helix-turn-helix transcriptional regulator [Alcanivorax sp. 24]|uniref:AraC family transcriptional regulator n=1 Tax=Alcanivorax sp. 24 TaxID=2545266 RepID=UPI00105B43AC|nr:helix-turn-helix transcriptional regulator [Alcanivorax sp. 24]
MLIDHASSAPFAAVALDYSDGWRVSRHSHRQAQFLYAASGLMRVISQQGAWVIPPTRGVWIPPYVEHEIVMSGVVRMRTLFIDRSRAPSPMPECCVLAVTPLLREMILRAVDLELRPRRDTFYQRLQALILSEIFSLESMPLHLPMPRDRRLQVICQALMAAPRQDWTLDDWGLEVGASARTLSRLFTQELGMSFGEWRQRLRLTEALPRLLAGDGVQKVARDLGYGSSRAFSSMFRRLLGATPSDYLRHHASGNYSKGHGV